MHTPPTHAVSKNAIITKLHILGLHALPVITRERNVRSKKQSIGHYFGRKNRKKNFERQMDPFPVGGHIYIYIYI